MSEGRRDDLGLRTELCKLAEHCEYGTTLSDMLRDKALEIALASESS